MARTRRCNGKHGGRKTRRQCMHRQAGGQNRGLDYLLFGDKTTEGGPRTPLTLAKPSTAVNAARTQGAMDPFRKQINQRYDKASAQEMKDVIKNVQLVSEKLESIKTMPELMAEIHKKFDSLMNNISKETKSLGKESQEDLTALILLFSSDALMNALKAEAADKEEKDEKAAKEKQEGEAAEGAKSAEGGEEGQQEKAGELPTSAPSAQPGAEPQAPEPVSEPEATGS